MMDTNLLDLWKAVLEDENSLRLKHAEEAQPQDIEYLEKLGACPELIEVAAHKAALPGRLNINWARDRKSRDAYLCPFTYGAVVAKDMDDNLVVWRDVRDVNSNIILIVDEPKTAIVIADNITMWLGDIFEHIQSTEKAPEKRQFWSRYLKSKDIKTTLKTLKTETLISPADETLDVKSDSEVHINFSNAPIGTAVKLKYFGRHTQALTVGTDNVLTLTKRPIAEISRIQMRERSAALAALIVFGMMTILFNQLGDGFGTALGKAAIFLFGVIMLGLAAWSWKVETAEDKKAQMPEALPA